VRKRPNKDKFGVDFETSHRIIWSPILSVKHCQMSIADFRDGEPNVTI